MTEALNVYVHEQLVGHLTKEQGEYIFQYVSQAEPEAFVSLTMPARRKGYVLPSLHPIFEMHLPEGYLLALIKKQFAKLTGTDDFGLLRLLAPSIRGRVHYDSTPDSAARPLNLDDLLQPGEGLFDELVERFALRSALSGVQPKVLAQLENKVILKLDDYIVKAWGPEYPELALNEYCCMLAAREAGIPVPECHLSDDDALFIMKRFDLTDDGPALGFEDMCVLQARQREEKYTGSCEQLAKTIKQFCSPAHKQASLAQFFKMTVLNQRLQNGDAHLKNFGLIYEDTQSVRIAPGYDIVSTTAYIKRDIAALTLMGSKKWWGKTHLIKFGMQACDLTHKQASALYEECEHGLMQAHSYIQKRLAQNPNSHQQQVLDHLARLCSVE